MKISANSFLTYLVFVVLQLVMTNYFHLSQFVTLTILPALVLCLPLEIGTFWAMIIAFATGFSVDLLAEGVVGLNTFALVPVAFLRKTIISAVLGEDIVNRHGEFTFRKHGVMKTTAITAMGLILFLIFFIGADGAGMRPFWFNLVRFLASTICSLILCLGVVKTLNTDERR